MPTYNLNHGYVLYGEIESVRVSLLKFLKDALGAESLGNVDFFHETFETLAIDDSRRIKEIALAKRFSEEKPRIFLIELYGATREAQNALLKLLEEPEPGNHFFVVVPSADILLATLRSRLSPLALEGVPAFVSGIASEISAFLASSLKEKIARADGIAGDIADEKIPKHAAIDFLNAVERSLYEHWHADPNKKNGIRESFGAIARARDYMNDRAPSVKMLLEYVALTV